ncbi:decarboxylating 6-phosphogluconate dehydrogenase [Devosia rhodophyticola]|uniref:Decarboxylating 6-phosphogluconate dehydrogenase n=1 Tax=Devosia rhodophyticola TaxID=3026423 RepID=A0ABY7YV56_9HYPH|nr:decarboxylating 6-phosphogluconate dehydrogenase [Devosia rhodophyticola]WDR05087.1 decarboxylating 6-phosphogluconate dehydrogenase [Devosia rhodophyticola]
MQLAMIGLGRMGANMVRRLLKAGHECVVFDLDPANVSALVDVGAVGATSMEDAVAKVGKTGAVWLMLPAAVVGPTVEKLADMMQAGGIIIDGGNSFYHDDIDRGEALAARGINYLDVGTSGGVWGLDRGYCLMIGGPVEAVKRLDAVFAALAPGLDRGAVPPVDAQSTAYLGYLHCGPTGAGHYTKMVHNGIEYGVMAAYAEGINILKAANEGKGTREVDAETTPLRHPKYYQFDIDLSEVAEVWRHGSVIGSWLLDLTAQALKADEGLTGFGGRVSDSGEGRWTLQAAIETGVPAPVLSSALFGRFSSRGESEFADRLLSAMRLAFGGHLEKPESDE